MITLRAERDRSGCGFAVWLKTQTIFKITSLKIIFLYLPAKTWAQGSVVSLVRVDYAIKLHHQLSQEKHWAMNLGPSRYKAFNFTLEKNEIFLITQLLGLDFGWVDGVGFRNLFNACTREYRMKGKTRDKHQTLVMCFNVCGSNGFFLKFCLFGRLWMVAEGTQRLLQLVGSQ